MSKFVIIGFVSKCNNVHNEIVLENPRQKDVVDMVSILRKCSVSGTNITVEDVTVEGEQK